MLLVKNNDKLNGELSEINKKNLKLSYEIEDLTERINEMKRKKIGAESSLFLTEEPSQLKEPLAL